MKKIKIFLLIFLTFFGLFSFSQANAEKTCFLWGIICVSSWTSSSLQKQINWKISWDVVKKKVTSVGWALKWWKDIALGLVFIITVWAFVYLWIKMAAARWNPEEFKKAWMHLVYIIIWLFVIFISWQIVIIVSRLSRSENIF